MDSLVTSSFRTHTHSTHIPHSRMRTIGESKRKYTDSIKSTVSKKKFNESIARVKHNFLTVSPIVIIKICTHTERYELFRRLMILISSLAAKWSILLGVVTYRKYYRTSRSKYLQNVFIYLFVFFFQPHMHARISMSERIDRLRMRVTSACGTFYFL